MVITYDSTRRGTYHQNSVPSLIAVPPNWPVQPLTATPVTRSPVAAAMRRPFAQFSASGRHVRGRTEGHSEGEIRGG